VANLLYLVAAIVATALICTALYVRNRKPTTLESGIDSFQRELKALSPERHSNERGGRRSG